jgi:CheY-like chemotaxis protein
MSSVLIVDDLVSIHEMLESVIHPTGLHSSFASDGSEALEKYKAERFDLVLADVDMKPMDGITLLKSLRLYDPSAVIIIMTAYASTDSAVQALKYGAFDYIQKPFKVDELINIIKRGLEYRQFQLESAAKAPRSNACSNRSKNYPPSAPPFSSPAKAVLAAKPSRRSSMPFPTRRRPPSSALIARLARNQISATVFSAKTEPAVNGSTKLAAAHFSFSTSNAFQRRCKRSW